MADSCRRGSPPNLSEDSLLPSPDWDHQASKLSGYGSKQRDCGGGCGSAVPVEQTWRRAATTKGLTRRKQMHEVSFCGVYFRNNETNGSASKPHGDSVIVQQWFVPRFNTMMCVTRFLKRGATCGQDVKRTAGFSFNDKTSPGKLELVNTPSSPTSCQLQPRNGKPMMNPTCGSHQVPRPVSKRDTDASSRRLLRPDVNFKRSRNPLFAGLRQ
jgi:hypothetical protein